MMRKHMLLAAAAASAAATAASADEVVVYGLAMPFLENVKTQNATNGVPSERPALVPASAYTGINDDARWRISSGTSNLGFRGSETLGPGLKVVWQMESAFQVDQNTGPGWSGRNSKIGLQSPVWGEVNLGQWDTPYKFVSLQVNPLRAGYVFDYTPIMGNPGFGVPATTTQFLRTGGKPDAAFDRRQGNLIQYWSPRWAGFSFRGSWSTDEGRTDNTATTAGIRPQQFSAALIYDAGPLSVRYAYDRHDDYFGLSALSTAGSSPAASFANKSSKDEAHKLVVLWRIHDTRIAAEGEQIRYRNDETLAGGLREYKRSAWYALVEQFFWNGASSVWVAYGRAQDGSCQRVGGASCSTRDLGAQYWNVGWIYRFSRRTEVFLTYYKVDNRASGTYSVQPIVNVAGVVAPGADTVGAGLGIAHYF
jgi:predicted porin